MADQVVVFLVLSTFAFGMFVCCLCLGACCSVATGKLVVDLVACFPLSCAVSVILGVFVISSPISEIVNARSQLE